MSWHFQTYWMFFFSLNFVPFVQKLLSEGLDVNILDYKGATPLHRARDGATVEVMQLAISEFASTSISKRG